MNSNPFQSPSDQKSDETTKKRKRNWLPKFRSIVAFPVVFVMFTLGCICPSIYTIAGEFYETLDIKLPILTEVLVRIPPSMMVVGAMLVSASIIMAHGRLTEKRYLIVAWSLVIASAILTSLAVFLFLSPLYAIILYNGLFLLQPI